MDIHAKMKVCLKGWCTDMDLWMEMRSRFDYDGSPLTLSRERRKLAAKGVLEDRSLINKRGVKYKQSRVIKERG